MMILLLILLSAFLNQASPSPSNETISFSFPSFEPESCTNGPLICTGAATAYNGFLSLTSEPFPGSPSLPLDKVGRVLYYQPVLAWPASITTVFTVRISKYSSSTDSGDGMTFIFAPNSNPSPIGSYGSNLGLSSTYGGITQQLAVELDTYKNEFDIDGNHVGIDISSVSESIAAESLTSAGIDLKSGRDIRVIIHCDGSKEILSVYVQYVGKPPKEILHQPINLSAVVPSSVYVGFTAATGDFSESHQLLDWSFTSTPLQSN